jgi:hypothetical protein
VDLLARLRGWSEYAGRIEKVRQTLPHRDAPILVVGHRYHVSALAFYLPDHPRVYHWPTPGKIDSQYALWAGLDALKGRELLVVFTTKPGTPLPEALAASFSSLRPLGNVEVQVGNGRNMNYQLYAGRFDGVPPQAPVERGEP